MRLAGLKHQLVRNRPKGRLLPTSSWVRKRSYEWFVLFDYIKLLLQPLPPTDLFKRKGPDSRFYASKKNLRTPNEMERFRKARGRMFMRNVEQAVPELDFKDHEVKYQPERQLFRVSFVCETVSSPLLYLRIFSYTQSLPNIWSWKHPHQQRQNNSLDKVLWIRFLLTESL